MTQIAEKQKEQTVGFVFAWVAWLITGLPSLKNTYHEKGEGKGKRRLETEKNQQAVNEARINNEGEQWILLSIIWYLTAIRESCVAGSRSARQVNQKKVNKKKTKRKQQNFYIPRSGVLFMYAPTPATS